MTGHRFLAEADAELAEAVGYYASRRKGLGRAFLAEVRRAIDLIGASPEIGTPLEAGIRRRVVRRYPYSLLYSIDNGGIVILAVMHHKRRPGYWRGRG